MLVTATGNRARKFSCLFRPLLTYSRYTFLVIWIAERAPSRAWTACQVILSRPNVGRPRLRVTAACCRTSAPCEIETYPLGRKKSRHIVLVWLKFKVLRPRLPIPLLPGQIDSIWLPRQYDSVGLFILEHSLDLRRPPDSKMGKVTYQVFDGVLLLLIVHVHFIYQY